MSEIFKCEKCGHFLSNGEYESRVRVVESFGEHEYIRDIIYYKCPDCGHVGPDHNENK